MKGKGLRLNLDIELPEYREYQPQETKIEKLREEIEYLMDQIELERNKDRCICKLIYLYRLLKRGLPKEWKQDFARRIERVLIVHAPTRDWQRESFAPKSTQEENY